MYHEDKSRVKDALKLKKVTVLPTWTFEDFKATSEEDIISSLSDINLQLVFEDLIERAKEREEKELKKRQRLVKDFTDLLYDMKEITASSTWEECHKLFGESSEYKAISDENIAREAFEDYVVRLVEKAKEKEPRKEEKEKRKEKEQKERENEKEKEKERSKKDDSDSENIDTTTEHKEDKKERKIKTENIGSAIKTTCYLTKMTTLRSPVVMAVIVKSQESMHIHPNMTTRASIRNTRKVLVVKMMMVLGMLMVKRSLKMESLARMEKFKRIPSF
nr:pre-mRNA-processing protein 40A isoform X3 [Tanacetum cinerariifolium]